VGSFEASFNCFVTTACGHLRDSFISSLKSGSVL
jgi:hypothetical protein